VSGAAPTGADDWSDAAHALDYLERADRIPHRAVGERVLVDLLPPGARRVVDLGAGDGRLLALALAARPDASGVALDASPTMLAAARRRFAGDPAVEVRAHDLGEPLPADLAGADAIVSSFAIHHLEDPRKRELYAEARDLLAPGGVFANLEHVASPTPALHAAFLSAIGYAPDQEDGSNRLVAVEPQLGWLRDVGLDDVDCLWKWREMALLAGVRPPVTARHGRATAA
jgi:tRNA (cmo5U34)-methyltransferase